MHARLLAPLTIAALVAAPALAIPAQGADPAPPAAPALAGTPTSRGLGGAVTTVDPRDEDRSAGPQAGRQRRRRRRRDGRRARGDRALQRGHRRRRLLRLLQRRDRQGQHHRRPRDRARRRCTHDAFIDPATGKPYPFTPELVTSGVSVGVPGTPATWDRRARPWGTCASRDVLEPAVRLAEARASWSTRRSTSRPRTTRRASRRSPRPASCSSPAASRRRSAACSATPTWPTPTSCSPSKGVERVLPAASWRGRSPDGAATRRSGRHRRCPSRRAHDDAGPRGYDVVERRPTTVGYRGYDVYGMAPSSSGGIDRRRGAQHPRALRPRAMTDADALHHYLEASRAGLRRPRRVRRRPGYVACRWPPCSTTYAAERACLIDPRRRGDEPVAAGRRRRRTTAAAHARPPAPRVDAGHRGHLDHQPDRRRQVGQRRRVHPHHRADRWLGHRGARPRVPAQQRADRLHAPSTAPTDPNRIQPGKRPRSSMSPTIVLKDGKPLLALGSPGGSTIITTVLQMLVNRIDRGMTLPQAIAAPRASQRNTAPCTAEQAFIDALRRAADGARAHVRGRRCAGHLRRRDRGRDGDRVRRQRPDRGGRRARPPRRRRRRRGGAGS